MEVQAIPFQKKEDGSNDDRYVQLDMVMLKHRIIEYKETLQPKKRAEDVSIYICVNRYAEMKHCIIEYWGAYEGFKSAYIYIYTVCVS